MTHAEQLERETEQARTEIANTLDELRACMTPGSILDQLSDRMNAGAAATFARNLRDQAVNNPLPVTLIGTGLAWLMLGGRGSAQAGDIGEAAADATDTIHDRAGAVAETMQRTAAATKGAGQRTLQSGSALVDFCRGQPLVLAGMGIAMGAIIGALLPATDAENRLMGESSDRLKARTPDLPSRQGESADESAKRSAEPSFDTAQEEAAHALDERKAADRKDDAKQGGIAPGAEETTLAPKGPDESRGQPWSSDDAPL